MKLAKLSLVTLVVAGLTTCSFAADTLVDAFKNGKVKGELKAYYFDADKGNGTSAGLISTGLELGYVTDSLYGFNLGATIRTNHAPFADDDAKALFKYDMYGSGAALSEAYIGYKTKGTKIKVGRQYFATPALAGSGSRMFKESFQGASVFNKSLPATTLMAGFVNKFQGRTSTVMGEADGDAPTFEKRILLSGVSGGATYGFDNAYTIFAMNKSIPNLTLMAQYLNLTDVEDRSNDKTDISVYFGEAKYTLPLDGYTLECATSIRASRLDTDAFNAGGPMGTNNYNGTHYSGRIAVKGLSGFGASFSAATTSDDKNLIAGISNGAGTYTATMIRQGEASMRASTDSYKLNVSYDFSKIGVKGLHGVVAYGYADQGEVATKTVTTDIVSYAAALKYSVASLKGLSFSVQYETQEEEKTNSATNTVTSLDRNELRFRTSYKF